MAVDSLEENGNPQTLLDRLYPKADPNLRNAAAKFLNDLIEKTKAEDSDAKLKDALSPSRTNWSPS